MFRNKWIWIFLMIMTIGGVACTDRTRVVRNEEENPDPTETPPPEFSSQQFMTAQDVANSDESNLSITNGAGASVTASGLYIASYDVNDCSACFGNVVSGNQSSGAMVGEVSFEAGQSIKIGKNYLYNLIYNGLYSVQQLIGSPCKLPGCSWPGDDGSVNGWCLTMGVISRQSTYTSSSYVNGANPAAKVVPFGTAVSSLAFNYKYDLIDPNTFGIGNPCFGPVVCDDETLTCSVTTPQSRSFQAY